MKSNLSNLHIKNKTVLLRIDGNVPLDRGVILDDQRLRACLPTIKMLLDHDATVILLTHIGRPQHKELAYSTRPLATWFADQGIHAAFAQNPADVQQKKAEGHALILMENLRFFPGEKGRDPVFAKELAGLGDYYIDDAFGSLARSDTSLTLLPDCFDSAHKTIGLLVEHELNMLEKIKKMMLPPSILILGGNKPADKIPFIAHTLQRFQTVLVGPALCFNFLKAEGKSVGNSAVDNESVNLCKEILIQAQELHVRLSLPIDYIIAEQTFDGPIDLLHQNTIPNGDVGVSIGPKTAALWSEYIRQAKSIVFNGLMGTLTRPETLIYVKQLYKAAVQSEGLSIVCGGDSCAAAYYFDIAKDIDYLSTGGSAALFYLYDLPLPALDALKNRTKAEQM